MRIPLKASCFVEGCDVVCLMYAFSFSDLKFSSSLLDQIPSFPSSQEDYDTDIVRSNDLFSFGSSNDGKPLYQCYSCEQPDCDEETICDSAHQVSKATYQVINEKQPNFICYYF